MLRLRKRLLFVLRQQVSQKWVQGFPYPGSIIAPPGVGRSIPHGARGVKCLARHAGRTVLGGFLKEVLHRPEGGGPQRKNKGGYPTW